MKVIVMMMMMMMMVIIMSFGSEPKLVMGQGLCKMSNEGLNACKPYVSMSGQNPNPPNQACCSALSNADLQCLCHFKDSGLLTFYNIDPDKAMALPLKCNIVQPSFHC